MPKLDLPQRREFIRNSAMVTTGWCLSQSCLGQTESGSLHVATFQFDVTPPIGHGCCGGWIKPIESVDDTHEAAGIVLLGAGKPIVLCSVDWTGILNEAHVEWRSVIAQAAQTTPDRVAVHCVHQHNAPLACLETERLVDAQGDLPHPLMVDFFRRTLDQASQSISSAIRRARSVTHIGHGQAKVVDVASNRRVYRDESGKVLAMRGSSCTDEKLISLPEGLIDPMLRTISFFERDKRIAALHYYATHPMSFYGDGKTSSDFVGLARKRRQKEDPECLHVYFTGCAGNIAAGKYNRGTPASRQYLTQRIYDAFIASDTVSERSEAKTFQWRTAEMTPVPHASLDAKKLEAQISTKTDSVVSRNRSAYQLSWLRRIERRTPIILSSLHIGEIRLLHLPGEPFIEYQLRAQQMAGDSFVATAAYGDCGPWYIPTKEEYPNGGYEVSVAFCDPSVDQILSQGISKLIQS